MINSTEVASLNEHITTFVGEGIYSLNSDEIILK